ncbi:MAG TPA: UdgX family uracil-DNA binding protein [Tepidisphaeraceae bacterium]|jgi:DNA polymerase|nr:UdgX family uracil-DNA binding protein [Tepidisphaeraceae bacterium]
MKRSSHAVESPVEPSTAEPKQCPATGSARDFLPAKISLTTLKQAIQTCHGCALYCHATQSVFGEGLAHARLMLIGEQPGDQEDLAGKPFVGPAGRVLDEALEAAGIAREDVYVTNAVKHFKFVPRGKRRIHAKPTSREIAACRPWLEAEIQVVKPEMIVCLGATAAGSLLGNKFRLTQHRGEIIKDTAWSKKLLATVHPSSLLRIPDADARHAAKAEFLEDFKLVAKELRKMQYPS